MTSKLNQRGASILAGFGIGVLVILIVLLWVLVGHGGSGGGVSKPGDVPRYISPSRINDPSSSSSSLSSSSGSIVTSAVGVSNAPTPGPQSNVEGYGHNVTTELVRPIKISPPPLHQHDIFYEQIYNQRLVDNDTTPDRPTIRHHSGHFRHRQAEVWDPHPQYEVPAFGLLLHLVLAHDDSFVPPTLKVTHVWTNLTQKVVPEVQTAACYYTGKVQGETDSKVAVSLCGGMTGYIRSRKGNFYIEPAEPYHNVTVQSILHKIHRVQDHQEAAGHVDDETCDTSSEWPRTVLDDIVSSEHHLNKRDASMKNFIGPPYRLGGHSISNREYFIETLVVVDRKMAEYHKTDENLIHYVLTLMSYVSLLFKDATIGNPISISVVDIMIVRDYDFVTRRPLPNGDDFEGVSSAEMLKRFCNFQNEVLVNSSSTYRHDTALLLTRETICRNISMKQCDTLGLAELGTMCNPSSSCAIVKDKGLPTSYTIAHELGHMLSMPHDDDYKCKRFHGGGQADVKHIMHKTMQNESKPWLWSDCSKHFVTEYLDSSRAHCLFNEPGRDLATNMTHSLPGETFDIDQQCELVFGNGSKICSYMPACGLLWCGTEQGEREGCKTQSLPWADGTSCGPEHWCYRGKCVMSDRDLLQPIAGGWGPWRRWGACSRQCGGGIQKSERSCDAPRPANGGPYCIGPSVRYMSCNTDQCRQPQFLDFREEQCAAFNGNRRGLADLTSDVKWVPKYGGILADHMCKLYCRVHQTNAYYLLGEKVIDGTKCGLNTFDICVNGICRRGGCDNRLDSNLTLDECGICGGDNSRCEEISGTYNVLKPTYGYNKVIRIPRGSSSIDIRQHGYLGMNNDSNFLALVDSETGTYILNGDFTVSTFDKVIMYAGVPIEYTGSKWVIERINSTSSIQLQKDLIVEYLSVGHLLPPNITYSYKIMRDSAPRYSWQLYDEWSSCSSLCSGSRHMIPRCVEIVTGAIVSDEYCESLNIDGARNTQDCNTHCKLSWKVSARQQCSAHCGQGLREVQHQCVKIDVTTEAMNHLHLLDPMSDVDEMPWAVPVNENHCSQISKPAAYEPCEGPCDATRWEYDEWSICTKSCDGGFQMRRAKCMDTANNMLEDVACEGTQKIVEQACNTGKCPTWTLGDWSPCSVTCGKGIRKKPLFCQLGGRVLKADACDSQNIPPREEACILKRCFSWNTAEWASCSVTCGAGIQKRRVTCTGLDGHAVSVRHCEEDMLRPNSSRICRMDECPTFSTDIEDNSIHPNSFDLYGGFKWQWGPWGECSQSCNGGTRSRNVACQNGTGAQQESMCDAELRPKHGEQCNMAPCPVWNHDEWSECDANCKKQRRVVCQGHHGALVPDEQCLIAKRPEHITKCMDRRCQQHPHLLHHHRYKWKMGPWGACSKTCSADNKTRTILCTDQMANGAVVSPRHCSNSRRPKTQRACLSAACEYVWVEGPWILCTKSCNKGVRYRNVTCHRWLVLGDKHRGMDPVAVEGHKCKAELKPHTKESCLVRYCNEMHTWHTGTWGRCSHDCGTKGRQFRKLWCLNRSRKSVPKRLCAKSLKPPRKQKCNQHTCVYKSCADVQQKLRTHQNQEYDLTLDQNRVVRVYCHAMDTSVPREYVPLPNDGRENYAEVYDKRLLDADTCPGGGGRNEQCACMAADSGRTGLTMFAKVRLNVTTLQLIGDDYTFARQSKGAQVPYGTAGDCYSRLKNCPQGRFSINLTGTGLKLKPDVRWVSSGPGASHTVHRQDDTKVSGKCGGYCGNCHPDYTWGLAVDLG